MLVNYLKIAWRNIARHKIYTAINLFGLTLGICACIVIYTIVSYEFSFDQVYPGKERIYRVIAGITESTGEKLQFARLPLAVSVQGRTSLSHIEAMAGIVPFNSKITVPAAGGAAGNFESIPAGTHFVTTVIAQPQFFDLFPCRWLAGNTATALASPFTVVLTESRARQYFGNLAPQEMIGRPVYYQDSLLVHVAGIVQGRDHPTDLGYTDYISFSTVQESFLKNTISQTGWTQGDLAAFTFVKLLPGTTPNQVNQQLATLLQTHADTKSTLKIWLEPLTGMHFNAAIVENAIRTADKPTLYSLVAIAFFIVTLAIVNFINLSTAQSLRRSKETGVRKVLGSSRAHLIMQFLTETALLTVFAVVLASVLVNPVLAAFRSFTPPGVAFHLFAPSTLLFLLLVTVLTTVSAGFYPAIVLSAYQPVNSLKGMAAGSHHGSGLVRKGLMVFQFAVSLAFIMGSVIIARQLQYMREKDPGFASDAIVTIETPRGMGFAKVSLLAQQIKQIAGVSNTALQWVSPMTDNTRGMKLTSKKTGDKVFGVTQVAGNEAFIPLYKIKLLAGRNLVKSDSVNEFVINETFARLLGDSVSELALGEVLYWNGRPYPVVGVVKDFHTSSLHDPITPLCIINRPDRESAIAIKMTSAGKTSAPIQAMLAQIEKYWKQIYPGQPFTYRFYDEALAMLYEKDRHTATLMNTAMAITIFISCIGLFGLTLYTAEKRAKEISIRKILGASVASIVALLGKDFIVLVLIALLIASPVAWYFMTQWLQGFSYRVAISPWVFIFSGMVATTIAVVTIGYQSIKAATANPVNNLRKDL